MMSTGRCCQALSRYDRLGWGIARLERRTIWIMPRINSVNPGVNG